MELTLALVLGSLCCYCITADTPWAVIIVESPQQPFYSGDRVTLKCEISQDEGWDWEYHWVRNGSSLQVSTNRTITVTLPDESGLYRCFGRREDLQSNDSPNITIVFKALPAILTLDPQSPVFPGENITLKCEIGSCGGWTFKWHEGSDSGPVYESIQNTFTVRAASNETKYWCQGERTDRPTASERSNEVNIQVMALPEAKLTAEPQSPVSTGTTVTLKCVIESHSNWTYKWYKDRKNNLEIEGNNFTITRATESDEGTYWCQGVRGERPTSTQLSNAVSVGKKGSESSPFITGVAVAGGVVGGVVLTVIILKVISYYYRRQKGPISISSSAGPSLSPPTGLAERHADEHQHQSDGGGLPVYETIPLTDQSRPVLDTVYDKLSLSKMGNLSSPCNPYQLVK
ncbi:low affinity immunoglobulin gamma Fc region receptor II-like [Sardina pilchardus]|uniref:low affinity immunoglobulin gamma Fc region receptor II-like n=1 Tax=Sardina pilchardus TaxID=27697 RepID=UPI002E1351A3